jgi:threonine/homoserine/homoserine lactone efflux protein
MLRLVASAVVGCTVGFLGAVPPGPVGLSVVRRATAGSVAEATRIGLGGATVDFAICTALALGASPLLVALTSHAAVRGVLSALYLGVGIAILVRELRRPRMSALPDVPGAPAESAADTRPSVASYVRGVLGGALNPTLIANWSLAMATLLATGLLAPGAEAGAAFAVGVGSGVFGWFALLARLVGGARTRAHGTWVRFGTLAAALALVVTGGLGAARTLLPG